MELNQLLSFEIFKFIEKQKAFSIQIDIKKSFIFDI